MDTATFITQYIQTVYDYFLKNSDWPTYGKVKEILPPGFRDFDEAALLKNLHGSSYRRLFPDNTYEEVVPTISQILPCEGSPLELVRFVQMVHYIANKYRSARNPATETTGSEISRILNIDGKASLRLFRLLQTTPRLIQFFTITNDNSSEWEAVFSPDITKFYSIKSLQDYLEQQQALDDSNLSRIMKSSIIDPAPIIEKVAYTDPTNIQATTANLMQIDNSYYINALQQSQRSFNWALIGGGVGVVFFIAAVFILIFRQPISESYVAAIITASSGGVVEIIAGIILVLHSRASNQANQCHERLNRMQRFLVAISHCENLEGDIKQTTRAGLINKLGDLQ